MSDELMNSAFTKPTLGIDNSKLMHDNESKHYVGLVNVLKNLLLKLTYSIDEEF